MIYSRGEGGGGGEGEGEGEGGGGGDGSTPLTTRGEFEISSKFQSMNTEKDMIIKRKHRLDLKLNPEGVIIPNPRFTV